MDTEKLRSFGVELSDVMAKAYDAAAHMGYALNLHSKGRRPSDGRTGPAAIKAEAEFIPANEAFAQLEECLKKAATLLDIVASLGVREVGRPPARK